jgi:hypothetical protein
MVIKTKNVLKLLKFRGRSTKSTKVKPQLVENNGDVEPTPVDINLREEPENETEKVIDDDAGLCLHDACMVIQGNNEQTKTNDSEHPAKEGKAFTALESKKTEDLDVLQDTCLTIGEHVHNRIESAKIETKTTEDLDVLHETCMAVGESVHQGIQQDVMDTPAAMSTKEISKEVTDVSAVQKTNVTIGERMNNVLGCISFIRGGQSITAGGKAESIEGAPLIEKDDHIEKTSNTDANDEKEAGSDVFHSTCMMIGEKMHHMISCT